MEIFLQPNTWVALLTLTFLEIILSHSATNTVIPFSMLGLNTGTYILIIDFGNGDVHYEKIVFIGH